MHRTIDRMTRPPVPLPRAQRPEDLDEALEIARENNPAIDSELNFNTGFWELIDLMCGFGFSRRAWHYACGV